MDPSYFVPEAMTALATASGDRRWRAADDASGDRGAAASLLDRADAQ
jgi:endo-1,4-beta-D-glucanase Y